MTVIDQFMRGQLGAVTFSAMLEASPEIQEEIRSLIPAEAIENKEHGDADMVCGVEGTDIRRHLL